MRFWDISGLVPLICEEAETERCLNLLEKDRTVLVWALSSVEIHSALCRKHREKKLTKQAFRSAKDRASLLWQGAAEVSEVGLVKTRAYRLLETHVLRAADAMQLAAALVAYEEKTTGAEFVTFDPRLAEAAEKEGFRVLGLT